jgi:hypothetical protein
MNLVEPGTPAESLIARAKNLLLQPVATWTVIDEEPATIEGLYKSWVLPLAAIPAVGRTIGLLAFGGIQIFGVRYHPSVVAIIGDAMVSYVLMLAAVYVLALVIDQFALQFGGERSRTQAFKLAAYSGTASWLAGAFMILPAIGGLFALLGGLYSLYLLYLGLPKLMRSDPDKTLNYFALALVVALVAAVAIGWATSNVASFGGPVRIG